MGHVAESINTLSEIYAILRFQRSPHGAQCLSLWGGRGLLVVSVYNNKWVIRSSYRSVILGVAVQAAQHVFISGQCVASMHLFLVSVRQRQFGCSRPSSAACIHSCQREAASFWV